MQSKKTGKKEMAISDRMTVIAKTDRSERSERVLKNIGDQTYSCPRDWRLIMRLVSHDERTVSRTAIRLTADVFL